MRCALQSMQSQVAKRLSNQERKLGEEVDKIIMDPLL